MCGPALILAGIGTAVSAAGTMYGAMAQAAGLKSQAQWAEREGAVKQMEASYQIGQMKRQTATTLGAQTAEFAGAGIDVTGGTPVDVALATNQEMDMDRQAVSIAGKEAALTAHASAQNLKNQASGAKTAGIISTLGTVVQGASDMYGAWKTGGGASGTSLLNSAFAANTNPGANQAPAIATVPPLAVSGGGGVNQKLKYGGPR
jgi:hypothetical protein